MANLTTLTERGQVSMPAALRKQMMLRPGQHLLWEQISATECRVVVVGRPERSSQETMRGFMKQFQRPGMPTNTSGWMQLLREGEEA